MRPAVGADGELVEGLEVSPERIGAKIRIPGGGSQPPAASVQALFKHREPFKDEARLYLVGSPLLSNDGVDDRRDTRDLIGVENMRVLVCDEVLQPVVVLLQNREVVGRRDEELEGVERKGRGAAVGVVGAVAQNDLRQLALTPAERDREALDGVFGDDRDAAREGFHCLIEMDAEVRRFEGAPLQASVLLGMDRGGAEGEGE